MKYNPRLTKSLEEFISIMENLGLPYPAKIGTYYIALTLPHPAKIGTYYIALTLPHLSNIGTYYIALT